MNRVTILISFLLFSGGTVAQLPFADRFELRPVLVDFDEDISKWNPTMTEEEIQMTGAARVSNGLRTLYIGTQQATATNQNPIVASFSEGNLDWVVNNYETGFPDGRAVGILWDQQHAFYVAMAIDGGGSGLESFTGDGWQSGYGSGGGARVTVLLRLDVQTGQPTAGTFSIARLSSGNTNSMFPTNLRFVDNKVVLFADSFFAPLDVHLNRMTQTMSGGSPFQYRVVLSADLETAISAEAIGWDNVTEFSPLPQIPHGRNDRDIPAIAEQRNARRMSSNSASIWWWNNEGYPELHRQSPRDAQSGPYENTFSGSLSH